MAARSGQDTPPNSTPTCADAASTTSRGLDATIHGCSSLPSARHRSSHQTADDLGFLGIEEFAVLPCHDTPCSLPLGRQWLRGPASYLAMHKACQRGFHEPVNVVATRGPICCSLCTTFRDCKVSPPRAVSLAQVRAIGRDACAAPNVLIWLVLRLIPGLVWEVGDPVRTSVKSLGEKN